VLNGSGGVGHLAVQLAKVHFNAYVVATTGPKHMDFVRSLGVDQAVDYTQPDWEAKLGAGGMRFDAIVDLVGGVSPSP
jgi:NADPH2:quinone reductase